MGDTLHISRALLDAVLAEAAGSTNEICGLLLCSREGESPDRAPAFAGTQDTVTHVLACRNVAEHPFRTFEIDPATLIATLRSERNGGLRLLGWYHSHPSGDTTPSPQDAADAAPDGRLWLITDGTRAAAWRAVRDGAVHGRFDPLALVVSDACV